MKIAGERAEEKLNGYHERETSIQNENDFLFKQEQNNVIKLESKKNEFGIIQDEHFKKIKLFDDQVQKTKNENQKKKNELKRNFDLAQQQIGKLRNLAYQIRNTSAAELDNLICEQTSKSSIMKSKNNQNNKN